jgi:hypothetical protein
LVGQPLPAALIAPTQIELYSGDTTVVVFTDGLAVSCGRHVIQQGAYQSRMLVKLSCKRPRVLLRSYRVRTLVDHGRALVLAAALVTLAGLWVVAGALGSAPRAARTVKVTEHVSLQLVKRTALTKFEHAGRASGTVSASVRSQITLSHSVVLRGIVTMRTRRGELRLRVDGRVRSLELRTEFSGVATMAGGTGRYADARGAGAFRGVVNHETWAATIDTTGSLINGAGRQT